jgi:hypothetical protein
VIEADWCFPEEDFLPGDGLSRAAAHRSSSVPSFRPPPRSPGFPGSIRSLAGRPTWCSDDQWSSFRRRRRSGRGRRHGSRLCERVQRQPDGLLSG